MSQLLDHMVEPALHRRGLYGALWRHFRDTCVRRDESASWFGFNLEEIRRLQEHLFGMTLLHPVGALRFDLSQREPWRGDRAMEVRASLLRTDRMAHFGPDADELWDRCAPRLDTALVRDARYLNWRYADCPDVAYESVAARNRLTGRLAGLAVLRLGWQHEPMAALVDWLVPDARRSVWIRLLGACHDLARGAGLAFCRAWLPPGSPDHAVLLDLGYRPESTPFLVSAVDDGIATRVLPRLGGRWHYTMGDTDIF